MSLRTLKPIILCIVLALIGACALNPLAGDEHAETYYLDAAGGFAIEHPADWSRSGGAEDKPVRWTEPGGESSATVASLPPEQAVGGYRRLLQDYAARRPGLAVAEEETVELASGAPALRVRAVTDDAAYLLFLVTTAHRAFVLEFAAPPQQFDAHRSLFMEMADSFAPL